VRDDFVFGGRRRGRIARTGGTRGTAI
jgi:hypothetical protein